MSPTKSSPVGLEVSSVKNTPSTTDIQVPRGRRRVRPDSDRMVDSLDGPNTEASWRWSGTTKRQHVRGDGGGSEGAEQQGAELANGGCYRTRLILGVRVTRGREK